MRPNRRRHYRLDRFLIGLLVFGVLANVWAIKAAQGRAYTKPPEMLMPSQLDGWKGKMEPTSDNYKWILPHARIATTTYTKLGEIPIMFTVIGSRDPNDMHTPDRCIMGSGFEIVSDELITLRVDGPGGGSWLMHKLHIHKNDADELVLYGYDGLTTVGGSTLMARIAMKLGGASKYPAYFVRFSTPVLGDVAVAERRLLPFAESMMRARHSWEIGTPG